MNFISINRSALERLYPHIPERIQNGTYLSLVKYFDDLGWVLSIDGKERAFKIHSKSEFPREKPFPLIAHWDGTPVSKKMRVLCEEQLRYLVDSHCRGFVGMVNRKIEKCEGRWAADAIAKNPDKEAKLNNTQNKKLAEWTSFVAACRTGFAKKELKAQRYPTRL